ncbi:DinB family protein [Luteococcus sp.]|uniref:mycothiol transferase n=1 Tax=Luteococcus sp. TaxID=1969402 RepID=UPI003735EDAD
MDSRELLRDSFERVADDLPAVLDGLDADTVNRPPAPGANSIGWLAWHLARVEDAQVADIAQSLGLGDGSQVWHDGWYERFGLPYPIEAHGYAMSAEDAAAFAVDDPELLADYHRAVHQATLQLLEQLDEKSLDRIVDDSYQPPVTAGVRLVSTVNDITQHLGQAGYARGLLGR